MRRILMMLTMLVAVVLMCIFSPRAYHAFSANTDFHTDDTLNWVATKQGVIRVQTFRNITNEDSIRLVIVIHGDAPFNNPGYQYRAAAKIAAHLKNVVAVGVLRPGYTDSDHHTSNGRRGMTTGDNYTPSRIETIAEVIEQLQRVYRPVSTIVIGHSGGAAIAADLIGLKPTLAQQGVLVSCPCNVDKWRQHMRRLQPVNLLWWIPVSSVSPIDVVKDISPSTKVTLIVGEQDNVTPPALSREYYQKADSLHRRANLVLVPGEGHEILLHPQVSQEIEKAIRD